MRRRKIFVLLCCVLVLLCASMPMQAVAVGEEGSWNTFSTDDGMIDLALPEGWIAFTDDTIPDKSNCDEIGVDREWLINNVNTITDGIMAICLEQGNCIIIFRNYAPRIPDLRSVTETELDAIVEKLKTDTEQNQSEGKLQVIYRQVYQGETDPYLYYNAYKKKTQELDMTVYQTIIGGEAIYVCFKGSYEYMMDEEIQTDIVNRIGYHFPAVTAEEVELRQSKLKGTIAGMLMPFLIILGVSVAVAVSVVGTAFHNKKIEDAQKGQKN